MSETTEQQTFGIGDTVRVINQQLGAYGKVGEVVEELRQEASGRVVLKVEFDFGPMRLFPPELELVAQEGDSVAHPPHYTSHPSGIECIQVTEHMGFNLGNALKYIWRCDLKQDAIEDLKKARWYIEREIARREAA